MNLLIRLVINGFAVMVTAYLLPGVHVRDFFTAVVVSLVLSIMNMVVKPVLILLTLPVTILTLGLFYFVINGIMVFVASLVVPGFTVKNFLWAILFSLILSVVNGVFHLLSR